MSIENLLNCVSYWRHLKHSYTLGKPFTMICKVKKKKLFLNSMENGIWGRGVKSLYPVHHKTEKACMGVGF